MRSDFGNGDSISDVTVHIRHTNRVPKLQIKIIIGTGDFLRYFVITTQSDH